MFRISDGTEGCIDKGKYVNSNRNVPIINNSTLKYIVPNKDDKV